ncbi:MAG: type III-B CRISPR module-associated protein Cmr3 [Bacillota bacterium]
MMLKITPLDPLFFRDNRPFTMGAENYAGGIFPPSPSVIYGALRSAYFSRHLAALPKAAEADDPTAELWLKGVFLQCGAEIHFPLPLDCVQRKNEKNDSVRALSLEDNKTVSSAQVSCFLLPEDGVEVENVDDGLLSDLSLQDYLALSATEFYFKRLSDYSLPEPKIGIARNSETHTAADHMLYRVEMRRLQNLSLQADFAGLELPLKGMLKLGGESRAATHETIEAVSIDPPPIAGRRFKLYLATPALFAGGWLPGWLDEKTMEGEYRGLRLRLLTACVGRYLPLGGFDIKKKQPKPLRRAAPAGSVYYFELLEGEIADVIITCHGQNISDFDAQQGFGLAYVGAVKR